MAYKKFSELKQGDTIYFLIDRYHILRQHGSGGVGFSNSNYGLIICSRILTSEWWRWHSPRTDNGLLFEIKIDEPISYIEEAYTATIYDNDGKHLVKYPEKEVILFGTDSLETISKKEGEESCIQFRCRNYNYYSDGDIGYIYTTKEELEKRIREVTDSVESNLKRIKNDLKKLK